MGVALAIVVVLIVGAVVGSALNFGGIVLGVPLVLLFLGVLIGMDVMRRQQRILQMKRFRRDARTQKIEFDTTDRRTVV